MRLNLEDNCTFINGGSWTASEYADSGYPVLKVSNFDKATISYNDLSYLQESSFDKYKKNQLKLHDIVIATVGSHPSLVNSAAGRCITVPKDAVGLLLNQNALCLRSKNENVIDQRYLGYLCKSQLFQHFIQQRGKGAANQMRIPIGGIKSFEMDFPEIETQRKIASILSAYDDLIENNLKRIKLLEEQAQQTYEEWFVRFKFPGYENVEFDEVSGLPVGWNLAKLTDLYDIKYGKNLPQTKIKKEGEHKVYGASGVMGFYEKPNCHQKVILVTSRGNGSGEVHRTYENYSFITNNSFVVKPKESIKNLSISYTQEFLKHLDLTRYCSGSAQPQLTNSAMMNIKVKVPSEDLLSYYSSFSNDLIMVSDNLRVQNQHLKEARDILLPRLMSGMINVDGLEVDEQLGMVAEENSNYGK
ncbi:restriction endonuclease subunit S [Lacinutrix cladophorae]